MKLSVFQENLVRALTTVNRFVAAKAQLPVLANVLLATDKGRLRLSATNLETGINFWTGAKIEKEGALCAPAKILSEYVASLPAGKIDLELKENSLFLSSGHYQASFVCLPVAEFPGVPTLTGEPKISLESQVFSKAISQVVFAAAQDEGRPQLNGVLMRLEKEGLSLVATDGYRLSLQKIKTGLKGEEVEELAAGLLIPARTLAEVGKIMGEEEGKTLGLTITPQSNQAIFSTPEAEIVTRLIEGKFPDYEKILPSKATTKIAIDRVSLLGAVRTASIFARESANIIKLRIENGKLIITANAAQVGDNSIELPAKIEGEESSIAFNSRYLLDFLNSSEGQLINFEMSGPLTPGVFTNPEEKSALHLIMPVRVQE